MDRLTFAEWFKREYPLYESEGRDTSFKAALRIAWETAERQSLSQEAVREEALAAATKACERHLYGTDEFQHGVRTCIEAIVALKREPNAAAEIGPESELGQNFLNALADETVEPAPAAPDVASMVKWLREPMPGEPHPTKEGWFCAPAQHFQEGDYQREQAATLLAKLGQGWIPVSGYAEARARFGGEGVKADKHSNAFIYFVDSKTQWFAMPLPPAPGASDE